MRLPGRLLCQPADERVRGMPGAHWQPRGGHQLRALCGGLLLTRPVGEAVERELRLLCALPSPVPARQHAHDRHAPRGLLAAEQPDCRRARLRPGEEPLGLPWRRARCSLRQRQHWSALPTLYARRRARLCKILRQGQRRVRRLSIRGRAGAFAFAGLPSPGHGHCGTAACGPREQVGLLGEPGPEGSSAEAARIFGSRSPGEAQGASVTTPGRTNAAGHTPGASLFHMRPNGCPARLRLPSLTAPPSPPSR